MKTTKLLSLSVTVTAALTGSTDHTLAQDKKSDQEQGKRQNVLFIIVDDLRTELNCYGAKEVVSPNIDALAAQGTLFARAYCNIPVSGASRASLLTGTRPTRDRFVRFDAVSEVEKPEITALNQHFKSLGYATVALGKIFHNPQDHADAWDRIEKGSFLGYLSAENQQIERNKNRTKSGKRGYAYECTDTDDDLHADGKTTLKAMAQLEEFSKTDKPFLLAVGFVRPHLPFIAPKKYWDMYDFDKITVPDNYVMSDNHGIPKALFPDWSELRNYSAIPDRGALPIDSARRLIHGYRVSVSFVDAQIGRIMAKLKLLGLDKNTSIVFLGDNGWNLGEHGVWCKHTLFETSLHTPMIIVDPKAKAKGINNNQVVEFVDIYPTICDMSQVEKPSHLEGESLTPLLNSPKAKSKGYAVCRWEDGYTLITDDGLFYTEWWNDTDQIKGRAMFDHKADVKENKNLIDNPRYAARLNELSLQLKARRGTNFDKYPPLN